MIDLVLLAVVAGVAWLVASEGAWNAGVTFLCVVFAGLLAMNFFEPLALILARSVPDWDDKWDMIALLGLFIGGVFALRMGTEKLAPTYVGMAPLVDQIGGWLFGAVTGYVTMAILLTALHTAPLPREFLGFRAERPNLFNLAAPDRQWLGFTQYVTEKAFARYDLALLVDAPEMTPHAFDGMYRRVGDVNEPYPNAVWPSFAIRYATRRAALFGTGPVGPAAAPVAAPRPVAPGPVPVAPSPGGSAGPGF